MSSASTPFVDSARLVNDDAVVVSMLPGKRNPEAICPALSQAARASDPYGRKKYRDESDVQAPSANPRAPVIVLLCPDRRLTIREGQKS